MRNHLVLIATTLGALIVSPPHPAQADDAYVCDDGRLVYARPETLEKLKATDPCVAKYFTATPQPLAPSIQARGAPADRTATAAAKPVARAAQTKSQPPEKPKAPEPSIGTDFRNVRIINASPGHGEIYRHLR
jgi:hypothetical protein